MIVSFLNSLSLGGTEKAACLWAGYLARRGQSVCAVSLEDGPRRGDLDRFGIPLRIVDAPASPEAVVEALQGASVIHAHAPGFPHQGDILGKALSFLPRAIPVVQTNIFGKLQNPAEDSWTDFRLFISWTSCVQAARRAGHKLDLDFFRRQSVAVYPVQAPDVLGSSFLVHGSESEHNQGLGAFRESVGLKKENVLFGRFSRPEPNKWTPLVLDAFLAAYRNNPNIRLLLREPPPAVAADLISSGLGQWLPPLNQEPRTKNQERVSPIILMPATSDPQELAVSQEACDVILHTSSIGESFGYGLAEPMALGKPVITNSVPWHDQAQIELVRHGECGFIASTVPSMKAAILHMAESSGRRAACGEFARKHILAVADPEESTNRVEMAMRCAIEGRDNPMAEQDLEKARKTAEYLDKHQWGHSMEESLWLRGMSAKVQFLKWQREVRNRMKKKITNGG